MLIAYKEWTQIFFFEHSEIQKFSVIVSKICFLPDVLGEATYLSRSNKVINKDIK